MRRMAVIWCDGEWIDEAGFHLSAKDRGATLGLGLFETMLAVDGVVQFVAEHRARLERSCGRWGWAAPAIDLAEVGTALLSRNGLAGGRARLRLTVTAGSGVLPELDRGNDARMWLTAVAAPPVPEQVAVAISPWRRNERSALAGLKAASYAENLVALDEARRRGFDETIFLNSRGELCEAATANVFLVKNGTVKTPRLDAGCLPGVAREVVLRLAGALGVETVEEELGQGDLQDADEIFLTSVTRGAVPVSRLEERVFPRFPVTERMRKAWLGEICRL